MESLIMLGRLDEEPMSAVLARVAYRHVCLVWHATQSSPSVPPQLLLQEIVKELDNAGLTVLAVWVSSMAFYSARGIKGRQWRDGVILRSRQARLNRQRGWPWKRVPPCY